MSGKKKTSSLQVDRKDRHRSYQMNIEGVGGINTAIAPNSIEDNECQALWNYLPVGKNLVRKVQGPLLYATLTHPIQAFFNDVIDGQLIMFVILSDGSAGIVAADGTFSQSAAAGTFNTIGATIDIANWQNTVFLITDAVKGYFLLGYLGAQIVTNGLFVADLTGWTGSGWAWNSANGGEALTGDGSGDLSQPGATVTIGQAYTLTYTITSISLGSLVASCGGVSDAARTSPGTYYFGFTALATTALSFQPITSAGALIAIRNISLSLTSGSGLVPTVVLLSSSLNGNSIAIWQGRVMIAQGRVLNYSGPLDYTFQPGSGAGTFNVTSTNLRQSIERIIPYMDSVYVIGDHAIVALTGTTISSDPTTWYQMETFNSLGTIYPPAVMNFQNNIYAPNEYGIFRIASTQSVKVDVMLDNAQFALQSRRADVAQINNLNFYLCCAYGYSPATTSNRYFLIAYCLELQTFAFLDFGFDISGVFTTRSIADHSLYCWSGNQIYRMFKGTGTVNGYIKGKLFDFGDPYVYKLVRFLNLNYKVYSGAPAFAPTVEGAGVDS